MRRRFPPKDEVFYEVAIGGVRYVAAARGDPYVTDGEHSIQLGHAAYVLYLSEGADYRFVGPGWYVCKYGPREIKLSLPLFGESDARHFADCFGIAFNDRSAHGQFANSPAGEAMERYFRRYPRRLRRCAWNYLSRPSRAAVAA